MRIPVLLAALLALHAPRPALAQSVAPGASALDPSRVPLGADTFGVVMEDEGETLLIGRLILRTEEAEEAGAPVLRRTEMMRGGSGAVLNTDTFSLARATLAPIRQRSGDGTVRQALDFAPGVARGRRTRAAADSAVEIRLERPAFYANSTDMVLAALPLASGYTAELPLADTDGTRTARIVVEARETVPALDESECEAWRIHVDDQGHRATYWITVDDHRIVIFDGGEDGIKIVRARGCSTDRGPART